MKSTYKLIWSDHALSELKEIINYLESNWTHKEISKLFIKIEKSLVQIEKIHQCTQKQIKGNLFDRQF